MKSRWLCAARLAVLLFAVCLLATSCGGDGGDYITLCHIALHHHGVCQQVYSTAFNALKGRHRLFNSGRAGGAAHAGNVVLFNVVQPPLSGWNNYSTEKTEGQS